MLGADRIGSRRRSSSPIVQVIAETLLGDVAIAAPFNRNLAHHLVLFAVLADSTAPRALWWHARPNIGRVTCGWPLSLAHGSLGGAAGYGGTRVPPLAGGGAGIVQLLTPKKLGRGRSVYLQEGSWPDDRSCEEDCHGGPDHRTRHL
jgi:hypothetical protein